MFMFMSMFMFMHLSLDVRMLECARGGQRAVRAQHVLCGGREALELLGIELHLRRLDLFDAQVRKVLLLCQLEDLHIPRS